MTSSCWLVGNGESGRGNLIVRFRWWLLLLLMLSLMCVLKDGWSRTTQGTQTDLNVLPIKPDRIPIVYLRHRATFTAAHDLSSSYLLEYTDRTARFRINFRAGTHHKKHENTKPSFRSTASSSITVNTKSGFALFRCSKFPT
jgi:hypothetical protein